MRLKMLISGLNITNYRFAKDIGLAPSSIGRMFVVNNNVSSDMMLKIVAVYPHVNVDWLVTGRGSMFFADDDHTVQDPPEKYLRAQAQFVPRHLHREYCEKYGNPSWVADLPEISSIDPTSYYRYFEVATDAMQTFKNTGLHIGDIIRGQYISPQYVLSALTKDQSCILILDTEIIIGIIQEQTKNGITITFPNPMHPSRKIPFTEIREAWLYRGVLTTRPIADLF